MVSEVYMTLGEPTPPKTPEEMLDACPLNGGLALIRAFIEAKARKCGFADIQVFQSPHTIYPNVDLRISFNSIAQERHADKVRISDRGRNLRFFEKEILNVTGYMNKNLTNHDIEGRENYTVPLSRDNVPLLAAKIKREIAHQLPTSAYIDQLKR